MNRYNYITLWKIEMISEIKEIVIKKVKRTVGYRTKNIGKEGLRKFNRKLEIYRKNKEPLTFKNKIQR